MTIYDLKPAFQSLLRPIADALVRAGITPNQVTIAALLLSLAEGAALTIHAGAAGPLYALPLVLLVRMALNAIDGLMAREHTLTSDTGKYLNEVGDVISDLVLYTPLVLALYTPYADFVAVAFIIFLIGIPISEMVGVMSEHIGGTRRYDGPMGKSDRAFWVSILAIGLVRFEVEPVEIALITGLYVIVLAALVWRTAYRRFARSLIDKTGVH